MDARHTLVILGSMDEFCELVRRAKARGVRTVVCDGYADGPAKKLADEAFTIDVRDTHAIAALCREVGADGIVTSFSDLMAECLVAICAEAGLPCYLAPEQMRYLREKPLMREMFAELGIPAPRSTSVALPFDPTSLEGLRAPYVVKPANGYGSRGVRVAADVSEVAAFLPDAVSYSTIGRAMVEEYDAGFEFNMMTWVVDGQVRLISIADREKTPDPTGGIPYVCRIAYPSRHIALVADEACAILQKVATFLGMQEGPLSMQFFYSQERGVQVCEVAGRLLGYEHELVCLQSGLCIEELLLDYVYDKDAVRRTFGAHDPFGGQCAAGLYFHGFERVVGSMDVARACTALPGVVDATLYYAPGQTVAHGVGAKPYVARYYLEAQTRDELDALTRRFYDEVSVTDADGGELLYRNELPA